MLCSLMVCVMGMKNIFMRWQKGDIVPTGIWCVGWWVQKTFKKGEDKTIFCTHNNMGRKKTDKLLPSSLVPTTDIENSTSQEPHLYTGMYHAVCQLSGQSFQSFTFCSFHLHLCSSVWLIVPEESLNTNPAWQLLEAVVLLYCGVVVYYGPEFYYFKDSQ